MNFSLIWTVVIFLYARGYSWKSIWVAKPYRPVFEKEHSPRFIMICGTTWLRGQKEVNLDCGIQAVYMYFNGTGISGGENIIMIHWVQKFSIRKNLMKKIKKKYLGLRELRRDWRSAKQLHEDHVLIWFEGIKVLQWKYLLPSISFQKVSFYIKSIFLCVN